MEMKPSVEIIQLPLSFLLLGLSALVVTWLLCFRLLKAFSASKSSGSSSPTSQSYTGSETEKDWTLPSMDSHAHRDSLFHRWDPRIKLLSLFVYIFCVASITQVPTACIALLSAIGSVAAAHIPFRHPLRRLAAMGGFLGMLLLIMPLTAPAKQGDTLVVFQHLSFMTFNFRGFLLALLICLKASAIALMMEPLLGTSPFSITIHALARLGVPQQVCQMILLTHRYIFVFFHEMKRMNAGMKARGFRNKTNIETVRTLGNFVGMLMVHSFERTQRVYEAMTARGYNGTLPDYISFQALQQDWIKGAFWIILGVVLVGMDRLW